MKESKSAYLNARIKPSVLKTAKATAEKSGISLAQWLEELIMKEVERIRQAEKYAKEQQDAENVKEASKVKKPF